MTDYSIRRATRQTDGEALLPLARDAVDEAQGPYATRRPGSDLPTSAFDLSLVFVAEDVGDKRLIGFVALRVADIADTPQSLAGRRADVTMLGVIPERRREGIGRALMERALREAKERGATLITLCVSEHNGSAIKLYESLGWQVIDRMMVFPAQKFLENKGSENSREHPERTLDGMSVVPEDVGKNVQDSVPEQGSRRQADKDKGDPLERFFAARKRGDPHERNQADHRSARQCGEKSVHR